MITGTKKLFGSNLVFIILLPVGILVFLLILTGCAHNNFTGIDTRDAFEIGTLPEDTAVSKAEIKGTETGIDTAANTYQTTETVESSTDEEKNSNNTTEEEVNSTDKNIDIYLEKSINIKRVYTIYEDIHTGSIGLYLSKELGSIEGYLFLSYLEVKLSSGRSFPCENLVKGTISGSLDPETGNILCEAKSSITAEGNQCFSGDITLNLIGTLNEDEKTINGGFILPSGNPFYFTLEKK